MNPSPRWRKSSHTGNFDCVELAGFTAGVEIRDSKDPEGPRLRISRGGLATLLRQVKADEAAI
ncbi:DUF397 domain-containing protein [Actinomadura graeca]|uniref:DUF397 domain-containing protein n=1 Tax=Actinomadura graeca TaxID=2750812 RepID=A0ABX8QRK8_9ACTN|nr:DUF397 domain-containing protein [Actinomadura graeca]QXJ21362.1 DUF397 domain-containing protein [Actinomadura graeca]